MAGEQSEAIPQELRDWLDAEAEERGVDRSELLERAVRGYRHVDRQEADGSPDLADLEARTAALETELDTKIEDVRERVIQVKRETDAKAPADHSHEGLRADLEAAADTVSDLEEAVDDLDRRVEKGFENYEEILEHLADASDDLESKLDTLADAVVSLRSRVTDLEQAAARRRAVADIREDAQQDGKSRANCENCGATVRLGLLDTPRCPRCGASFESYEPSPSFFRSAKLTVVRPPALEEGLADGREGGDDE